MTSPKEDQQPMTTREEFEQAWRERPWRHKDESAKDIAFSWWEAGRLASRQEVSVEELARVIDPIAFGIKPSMYGLRSQQELERHVFVSGVRGVARDKACALLAKYSITKRTTEG